MRVFVLLLALLFAWPAAAQRGEPRRPRLPVAADTNDARAYFRLGQDLLRLRPREAANAFYWASQIDPAWAEPLYGRYAALLLADPRRLVLYYAGDPRTHSRPEVMALDSLHFRAVRLDPFLRPQFERELVLRFLAAAIGGPHDVERTRRELDSELVMRSLTPLLRGRLLAGEGRLMQAMEAYDAALRERGRHAAPLRLVRHERARMFALAGNDSMARVELGHALHAAAADEESGELGLLYRTQAVLEHSMGMMHEQAGDPAAAREAYARALVQDLSYAPALRRLGALSLAAGDTATALRELAMAAEADPRDAGTRLQYATMLAAANQLAEAEAELVATTELAPYYADPWILLGTVREWRGEGSGLEAYRQFLALARRDDPRRARVEPLVAGMTAGR